MNILITVGLLVAAGTAAVLLWSVFQPDRRIWPPRRYTAFTPIFVWGPTLTLFGTMILLGILEWGEWPFHTVLRFGPGVALIVLGNVGVWFEVAHFGIAQTGGAKGRLKTDGLYRHSRNPQYVADIVMVMGWILLTASPSGALVGAATIALLIIAPFAEEPWLSKQYGKAFDVYRSKVRRFFWSRNDTQTHLNSQERVPTAVSQACRQGGPIEWRQLQAKQETHPMCFPVSGGFGFIVSI